MAEDKNKFECFMITGLWKGKNPLSNTSESTSLNNQNLTQNSFLNSSNTPGANSNSTAATTTTHSTKFINSSTACIKINSIDLPPAPTASKISMNNFDKLIKSLKNTCDELKTIQKLEKPEIKNDKSTQIPVKNPLAYLGFREKTYTCKLSRNMSMFSRKALQTENKQSWVENLGEIDCVGTQLKYKILDESIYYNDYEFVIELVHNYD